MDSLTQGALGGLCGELTLRKEIGWKGFAWGVLFGTLPDLDILAYPWLDSVEQLSWHRGLSHSILVTVLASFFFGWILSRIYREKGVTFQKATFFVFITWASHVVIDCFTTYGTQIYEPFSSYRFAWDNMSIVDLSFTLPMLITLVVALFFKKGSATRSWIGRGALTWICLYTITSFVMKSKAEDYFQSQLTNRGMPTTRMMTSPTLTNIFLWRMIAESDGEYHIAYWSFFDSPDRPLRIDTVQKGHEKLQEFGKHPEITALEWFAKDWHMVVGHPDNAGELLVIDMRFAEMCLPDSKGPVFLWSITEKDEDLEIQRLSIRGKTDAKKAISYLWQRVKGSSESWMEAPWIWER